MNRSRLRHLAAEYAAGRIAPAEYRERRRDFIDAVADGSLEIKREESPAAWGGEPTIPLPAAETQTTAAPPRRWPALLGIACGMGGLVLAVVLWPSGEQTSPTPPPAPALPAMEVPRARSLVESFLALRDFSAEAVRVFEHDWAALAESERDEARGALWFASLVRAMRDEVKTQNALVALGAGTPALERARRVLDLGRQLGVSEQLPALEDELPPTATGERVTETVAHDSTPRTLPDVPTTSNAPGQQTTGAAPHASAPQASPDVPATRDGRGQQVTQAPAQASAPPTVAPAPAVDTGRGQSAQQWLDARGDDELTLQMFAVNQLDMVEKLMLAHPELDLHVLPSNGAPPRYRVVHGVFNDAAAARSAYDRMPQDVTSGSGGAIVKSFAAVREDLAAGGNSAPPARAPVHSEGVYTLQLLASAGRSNAEALLSAFPALALQLREVAGDRAPYRVVYGSFQTEAAARAAAAALPPTLISRTGKPLAKALSESGTPLRR